MATKFDINTKPLSKAKPLITELMRDGGGVDWFEDCKAGQLLEIKSGGQKAYINLDYNKIKNFNIRTDETDFEEAKKILQEIDKLKIEYAKEAEKEEKKLNKEIEALEDMQNTVKAEEKKSKAYSQYDKRIEQLTGKYVKLNKNKIKNFGTANKPILGFVCYEKEFNALPYSPRHDSKSITQWLDDVLKNKKDFQAQRTEAIGKTLLWILLGLGVLAFIFFRWGAPALEKMNKEEAEAGVAVISSVIPICKGKMTKWLGKK